METKDVSECIYKYHGFPVSQLVCVGARPDLNVDTPIGDTVGCVYS